MRRVPVQPMESALAAGIGAIQLAALLWLGPAQGTLLIGGLALYTLLRQGLLHLRAERRTSRFGGLLTAAVAAFVLIVDATVLVVLHAR